LVADATAPPASRASPENLHLIQTVVRSSDKVIAYRGLREDCSFRQARNPPERVRSTVRLGGTASDQARAHALVTL